MKKINQRGFSPIVILLVLILMVLVGFTGYYVFNTQKDKNKTVETPAPASSTATPAQPSTQDAQKYLVIKEWGVKVPLSSSTQDAYYIYSKSGSNESVGISTTSITNRFPGCAADKTPVYTYNRFSDPNSIIALNEMKYSEAYPNAPKIGDYYYFGTHPQSVCMGSTPADLPELVKLVTPATNYFESATKQIQAQ